MNTRKYIERIKNHPDLTKVCGNIGQSITPYYFNPMVKLTTQVIIDQPHWHDIIRLMRGNNTK